MTTGHCYCFGVCMNHREWVLFPKTPISDFPEDRFQVTGVTSPLRGKPELFLSPQKLDAGGWGRSIQNPTPLPLGGTGSIVPFWCQRITGKDTEARLLEPHPCLSSPSSPLCFSQLLISFSWKYSLHKTLAKTGSSRRGAVVNESK